MFPSSSMWSLGPASLQLPERVGCRKSSNSSGKAGVGTAKREVPVSTTPLQPSSQKRTRSLSTHTDLMLTIQCPWAGSNTGVQASSPSRCFVAQPPRVSSLSSRGLSAKKTEKMGECLPPHLPMAPAMTLTKLNSGACDKPSSPKPKTPSNLKALKGSADISVAAINRSFTHPGASSSVLENGSSSSMKLAFAVTSRSMHTTSSTKTPVTSPVPKETVI
mmetsp:Transcript_15274/g.32138  ORF Transcript_15274/g.32138 Transcript_15274/m.32138 type:complete len:219 (-) Transcript_15274:1030-1686(-)